METKSKLTLLNLAVVGAMLLASGRANRANPDRSDRPQRGVGEPGGDRHLFALVGISQLKRGGTIEVRAAAVPNDLVPPKPGTFVKETMNALADPGESMGVNPANWLTEPSRAETRKEPKS